MPLGKVRRSGLHRPRVIGTPLERFGSELLHIHRDGLRSSFLRNLLPVIVFFLDANLAWPASKRATNYFVTRQAISREPTKSFFGISWCPCVSVIPCGCPERTVRRHQV